MGQVFAVSVLWVCALGLSGNERRLSVADVVVWCSQSKRLNPRCQTVTYVPHRACEVEPNKIERFVYETPAPGLCSISWHCGPWVGTKPSFGPGRVHLCMTSALRLDTLPVLTTGAGIGRGEGALLATPENGVISGSALPLKALETGKRCWRPTGKAPGRVCTAAARVRQVLTGAAVLEAGMP